MFSRWKCSWNFQKIRHLKNWNLHILTDTDSSSNKFLIISDPNSETLESTYREIIFEVITSSKIHKTFDRSHEYWDNFGARKKQKRKKLGHFELEHIDNPCILWYTCTIAANPKKYFEMFEGKNISKKHKGIKKGSAGLDIENVS